jgi:hypothetical protein
VKKLKLFFTENNYQESQCQDVLEEMRKCCVQWKSVSLCCEGIDIDDKKVINQNSDKKK